MSRLDTIDRFFEYGVYIPTRTVYLGRSVVESEEDSDTNAYTAERCIKGLHILEHMSTSPITIILNNAGGCSDHGMAIYDAIRACRSHVTVHVLGNAYSMGGVILQAADTRKASPNSKLMFHLGSVSVESHPEIARRWIAEDDRFNKWMTDMFLKKIKEKKPKFTRKQLEDMIKFDTILSAKEALELGLIDEITSVGD